MSGSHLSQSRKHIGFWKISNFATAGGRSLKSKSRLLRTHPGKKYFRKGYPRCWPPGMLFEHVSNLWNHNNSQVHPPVVFEGVNKTQFPEKAFPEISGGPWRLPGVLKAVFCLENAPGILEALDDNWVLKAIFFWRIASCFLGGALEDYRTCSRHFLCWDFW